MGTPTHHGNTCLKASIGTALLILMYAAPAEATCYRISTNTPESNESLGYYIEPGMGSVGIWYGSNDAGGSAGNLPSTINLNNNDFQPLGSMIASGTVNFMSMRSNADAKDYDPEQIFFRCTADENGYLYEFYATNGDSAYGGKYLADPALGLDEVYTTYMYGLGIRVKNLTTGEYYSRYWKSRPLNNLDTDSKGYLLVKAKNFSDAGIELFKIGYADANGRPSNQNYTGMYNHSQPSAYIAFKSKSFSTNLADGRDSNSYYSGFYSYWPGGINLYNRLTVRRSATCKVNNATPNVTFPVVAMQRLNNGEKVTVPLQVDFSCQTGSPANSGLSSGFVSGTATNQTAIGFLPDSANIASAKAEGLGTSGSGITHLLSDNYGLSNVTSGVGVRMYKMDGTALNFLSTLTSPGTGAAAGWYPVLDEAVKLNESNGLSQYSRPFNASLEALPGKTVTPGKFNAKVQAIIQVQ